MLQSQYYIYVTLYNSDNCSAYQFITGFDAEEHIHLSFPTASLVWPRSAHPKQPWPTRQLCKSKSKKHVQRIRCNFAMNARNRKGTNTKNKSHLKILKTHPSPTKHLSQQPRQLLWGCKCPGNEIAELDRVQQTVVSHLLLITIQQWVYRLILLVYAAMILIL